MSAELVELEHDDPIDRAAAIQELAAIEAELQRRTWQRDPVAWAQQRLRDHLWSVQKRILLALRDYRRVAVQSCHEIGKSFISSVAVGWWIDTNRPGEAFVVTSAPSNTQVRAILWREINRMHARGGLVGRTNQTEWYLQVGEKTELVAYGRKPDDYDPTSFQGIHAPKVLLVFDEACGIPPMLWEAGDSLIANDDSKALAIGNPDDPTTEFANICKPGSGWHVVQVGAFDTPAFTGEPVPAHLLKVLIGKTYVEEKRKKWAPQWRWSADGRSIHPPEGGKLEDSNPMWQSKVLGRFPELGDTGGLIPISWVRAAQERTLEPSSPSELGVDVGAGGDSSCIAHRRGPVVRVISEDTNPDTMQTTGKVVATRKTTGAARVKVDKIGIGKGVVDRMSELKEPVLGIGVGDQAKDPESYANARAEFWWAVRERFETGDIDIDPRDEDLAAELCSLRYKRTSRGQILIESKDDAKKRGIPSPNRADAVMLAFASAREPVRSGTWGR